MPTSRLRRLLAATCAATAGALSLTAAAEAASAPAGWRPYAPDSIWNLPVRADAPIHPESAADVAWLKASVERYGAWINSTKCSMPIFWADAGTPTVKVNIASTSYQDPSLKIVWSAVPMPPEAKAANCTDGNFAVFQRQPDGTIDEWEFWKAVKNADGTWTARWGGYTEDTQSDRGISSSWSWRNPAPLTFTDRWSNFNWNVTGSSVSMAAGVITLDDLARGTIDHAVSIAITDAAKGGWLWPAQRSDGGSVEAGAVPEGAHLRLDPKLDLSTLQMTPLVRMIAKAAQKYGIVVRDRTFSSTSFYVEEPRPGQADPVPGLLAGKTPAAMTVEFPWDKLQLLDAPKCTVTKECLITPKVEISTDATARVGQALTLDTSNSLLNHPRKFVTWDLDGDGTFETSAARNVKQTVVPTAEGPLTVSVRITTRDGVVTTGSRTLNVVHTDAIEPAPSPTPTPTPAPTGPRTLRPNAIAQTWMYAYGAPYNTLTSLTDTALEPAIPNVYRKLYTSHASGKADIDFDGAAEAAPAGSKVSAYVECAATRCLRLQVVDGTGAVLGQLDPPYGLNGWYTIPVGALRGDQVAGLRLKATIRNGTSASGIASIRAVSATLPAG